ncbi:pinin-like [Acanthaster planci]|uniref:Pinin n=1 Tax=Acanthaster planci TaxID=133434 RepID=A0A8B7ZSC6_ACAPL|nr:pinin-like [Acanthaster planci]
MANVAALLQEKLDKAKENLQSVDENIRKLTGREPGERRFPFVGERERDRDQRRVSLGIQGPRGRGRGRGGGVQRADAFQRLGLPITRRQSTGSAFSRLGGRVDGPLPKRPRRKSNDDDDDLPKHTIQSSVVATPKVVKTRQESIQEQNKDAQDQKRNRRMFGHLLGTLQKFKQESSDMESKERKRSEIEKKLEEQALEEKKAVAAQKVHLFTERRNQQAELQKLERLVDIAKEQDAWDAHTKKLNNFIRTKAKPPIFYKPAKPSLVTEKKLLDSKELLNEMMKKRRAKIEAEIRELQSEPAGKETEPMGKETAEVKGKTKDKKKKHGKGKHEERKNGKQRERRGSGEGAPTTPPDARDSEGEDSALGKAKDLVEDRGKEGEAGEGEPGKDGVGKRGSESEASSMEEEEEGELQERNGREAEPDGEAHPVERAGCPPDDIDDGADRDEGKEKVEGEAGKEEDFRSALYREDDQRPELSWEDEPMEQ